jgi:hypothetical protein
MRFYLNSCIRPDPSQAMRILPEPTLAPSSVRINLRRSEMMGEVREVMGEVREVRGEV